MKKAERTKPVKVNRLAIVLLSVGAHIVSYTPVLLLIDRRNILAYIIPLVALISTLRIRKFKSRATEAPNLAEFLLAGFEAIWIPAFSVLWSFLIYKLVTPPIDQFLQFLFPFLEPSSIALYSTIVFWGIIAAVTSILSTDEMLKNLYADIAGIRSKYFEFFTTNRSEMIGAVIISFVLVLVLVVLLSFIIPSEAGLYLLTQIIFIIVGGFFVTETSQQKSEKKKKVDMIDKIKMLLENVGYTTQINPRTGDAAIDPLLINLDIFAYRENHNLLIDIRSPMDADKIVDWKSAPTLIQSAYVLSAGKGIPPKDIDVRLILIDVKLDPSLKRISKRESIQLQYFSSKQINELSEKSNTEEQKLAIQSLLKLPHTVDATLAHQTSQSHITGMSS